jgi:hypothetical protein
MKKTINNIKIIFVTLSSFDLGIPVKGTLNTIKPKNTIKIIIKKSNTYITVGCLALFNTFALLMLVLIILLLFIY